MINSKLVLTANTVLGIFGIGWLTAPDALGKYWHIAAGENLNYMGHRYGALLIGIAVSVWLARNALNTQARRAVMAGTFVAMAITTVLSLYGATTLDLNAWPPFATELVLTLGLGWVLFVRSEPVV
jgi:predicted exporter